MKRNFVKFTLFLLPVFTCWLVVESFYRCVPNDYTFKRDTVEKHASEYETVLFGNSHCFFGLNPAYFNGKTYNFSNISQTLYFDHLLFERYKNDFKQLKRVVFCIEYTTLGQQDNTNEDVFRKYYYQQYMGLDVPIIHPLDPKQYSLAFTRSLERSLDFMYRYADQGSIIDCYENGWSFIYPKRFAPGPQSNAKSRASLHDATSDNFVPALDRLQSMISWCQARNIEVILVSTPQSRLYTSQLDPQKVRRIFQTCENLEREHSNVRYLNLFYARFTNADFYDADHLNEFGAAKCSKMVNAFIQHQPMP